MNNIYNYTYEDLEKYMLDINEKKFRAKQIYEWLYKKRANTFDEMSNLNKQLIELLSEKLTFGEINIEKVQKGKGVYKYLFKTEDGNFVEAVLMLHDYGNSLCISTQVGCNMGCLFCESGRLKRVRNLETYEMVLQILKIEEELKLRISHVVLMGIGEPFDNYDNVVKFLKIINSDYGLGIGARHITVSTCGIVPKIREFIDLGLQINLAISLHAPNDELRSKMMKINKVYPVSSIMEVVTEYIKKTNRRVTFEYVMLDNINDHEKEAFELVRLLRGINCYVNLIPYNETSNSKFKKSKSDQIDKFYDILKKDRINVTVRREFGPEISAACGQLRSKSGGEA